MSIVISCHSHCKSNQECRFMSSSATAEVADGIQAMLPREQMDPAARKLRDIYARKPGAPILHREFGYYCLERWYEQGLSCEANLAEIFHYDPPARHILFALGWC